jgi:hypothetical protein
MTRRGTRRFLLMLSDHLSGHVDLTTVLQTHSNTSTLSVEKSSKMSKFTTVWCSLVYMRNVCFSSPVLEKHETTTHHFQALLGICVLEFIVNK